MHESKCECTKYHTQKTKRIELRPSHMRPLYLTYSLPLPLWRQAPKPKGRPVGQEQTSRALRCSEKSRTMQHHPLTLSSERTDPLSLEVKLKGLGLLWDWRGL